MEEIKPEVSNEPELDRNILRKEIANLDEEILSTESKSEKTRNAGIGISFVSIFPLAIALAVYFLTPYWGLAIIFFIPAIIFMVMGFYWLVREPKKYSEKINVLKDERKRKYQGLGSPSGKADYFSDLVDINIRNLREYYQMVKDHTEKSFWAAIISAILGFVLIVIGLVVAFFKPDAVKVTDIATASGVIIEFIAGVFFYLYNRTVRQLKGYHDSLLGVQNILLSFKIIEDITDEKNRVSMLGKMLTYLVGKSTSDRETASETSLTEDSS